MIGSRGAVLRAGGRQLSRVLTGTNSVDSTAGESSNPASPVRRKSSRPPESGSFCSPSPSIMPEAAMYPMLEKLGLLDKDHVRIRDPAAVEKLVSSIVADGFSKLQVIADYDMTITKFHVCGKRAESSFGIMDNSTYMPSFYRDEANALLAKYYPIEIDPHMSEEEKIPYMKEWYGKIHNLIIKCKVSKDSLAQMVSASNARLREGTEDLCSKLHGVNVPVLVFSAGMGDILEQVLRQFNIYTENVKVVSNFFQYNEEGIMVGFKGDLIHMFNKNENAIHSSNYFEKLKGRSNVVLMGDSMGDIKMAVGVPQPNNVLKIGFLNDKIDERIDKYMNGFDIVLIDDQTMDVVNSIVKLMT